MTLHVDLSDYDVRALNYYLIAAAAASARSGDYIPDALFTILGHLSVSVTISYQELVNKTDESSKESVSD